MMVNALNLGSFFFRKNNINLYKLIFNLKLNVYKLINSVLNKILLHEYFNIKEIVLKINFKRVDCLNFIFEEMF